MVLNIIGLIILFILSAFFSGSETALMTVNRIRIRELVNNGDKKAALVDRLLGNHTRLLSTILIGNNLVNIAASAIATSLAISLFGSKGVGIATGIVTLVVLIFGEITPKSYGNKKSIKFSKFVAPYLHWMEKMLSPFITFFEFLIRKIIGEGNLLSTSFLSEEEIRRFVNVSEEEGVIKKTERKMINSIFEFDDTTVKEIMIPRIDIICANQETDIKKFVKLAVEKGHSRIPVYRDTIDKIIGVVYVKDILSLLLESNEKVTLYDFIRPAYFIPESQKINQLLAEMKRRKVHIAIILDEYGGTAGLITIEDLLEEIVGDIQDEYDLEPKQIEYLSDRELLVDSRVDIDDLNDILPLPLELEEGYETISGYILYQLGYLPGEGEKIELDELKIIIEKVSEHSIRKVRIVSDNPLKGLEFKE